MRYKTSSTHFNATCELVSQSYVVDDLGQHIPNGKSYRKVYCAKKSTPQNEYFLAGQSGIKSAAVFLIRTADYQNETEIRYPANASGIIYTIYRVYDTINEMTELYAEVRAQ